MGTYIATLIVGTVLSVPQGQFPVAAQSGGVYATNQAVNTMPFSGVQCQLQSYKENGTVRTVTVCR